MSTQPKSNGREVIGQRVMAWLERLASLLLLVVACFIGYDCFRYHQGTTAMLGELTTSLNSLEKNNSDDKRQQLLTLRNRVIGRKITAASIVMQWLNSLGNSGTDHLLATLYYNRGVFHSENQNAHLAARAFTLSLVCAAGKKETPFALAQECFYAGEWELGILACQETKGEKEDQAARLQRLFKKRLEDPETLSPSE